MHHCTVLCMSYCNEYAGNEKREYTTPYNKYSTF